MPDQTISTFLRKLWLTDELALAHRLRYRSTRTALLAAGVGLCLLSLGGTNWIAHKRSLLQPQPDSPLSSSAEADPTTFTAEELQQLQRRFGVHGPQPKLAQLFTRGVDQLTPLRNHTVNRLDALRPVVLRESRRTGSTQCCWRPFCSMRCSTPNQAKTSPSSPFRTLQHPWPCSTRPE